MAAGGLISGAGFLLLGQARDFSQFLFFRWLLVIRGLTHGLRWCECFHLALVRRMTRPASPLAGMGHGLAKVGMPLLAASLILHRGGAELGRLCLVTLGLVVGPALLFMAGGRKTWGFLPEEI